VYWEIVGNLLGVWKTLVEEKAEKICLTAVNVDIIVGDSNVNMQHDAPIDIY